jgi:hypothetical protein
MWLFTVVLWLAACKPNNADLLVVFCYSPSIVTVLRRNVRLENLLNDLH